MRKIMMLNTIMICGSILINSYSAIGAEMAKFNPVEPKRIPEILTLISDRIQSNQERIKTWQGERSVESDYIYEGPRAEKVFKADTLGKGEVPKIIREHREFIDDFSLDAEKELLCVNRHSNSPKPLQYTDFETGRDLGTEWTMALRRTIRTPEYQIDCSGNRRRNGVIISQRAVKRSRPENTSTCDIKIPPVYEPRKSFKAFKNEIWELFPMLVEVIQENGKYSVDDYDLKVEEHKFGDITEYRIILPSKAGTPDDYLYLFSPMVFSSDKGYNIVSYQYYVQNGVQIRNKTWDYEYIDGVYVPISVTEEEFLPDGKLRSEKRVTFVNLRINHAIPSETFEYTNLGLKDGDIFVDEIINKEYRYEAATKELKPIGG
jgi:hypothetical protein